MEEGRKWFLDTDLIEKYLDVVLRPRLIPQAKYAIASSIAAYDAERASYASVDLSQSFGIYKGSRYYYNGRSSCFIHYTTLSNAINIIREKQIRLYRSSEMDDHHEVVNALGIIRQDAQPYVKKEIQRKIFLFSMNAMSNESSGKSLSSWRNYGDDGRGVGLVFRFDKQYQEHWVHLMLSNVHYNSRDLADFKDAHSRYLEFRETQKFHVEEFENHFNKCFAFHKLPIYKDEKEMRLLYSEGDRRLHATEFPDLKRDGRSTTYIPIELEWQYPKGDDQLAEIGKRIRPYIELDRVILGYRIPNDAVYDIHSSVAALTSENYRKRPKVERSVLTKYFQ